MTPEKQVSITSVVACTTWIAAFGIWGLSAALGSEALGELSVLIVAVAVVGTLRNLMRAYAHDVKNAIIVVRGATEEHEKVRPLR